MTKKLRFAALIRVSGERQAKLGESLRTQESEIIRAVEQLGGTITKTYSGQEHATPGHERVILDALLADAQKPRRPFDAVIVYQEKRWSRDNVRSEEGLDILKENRIRFFVQTSEYNLFEPSDYFKLSLFAGIARLESATTSKTSIENRIHRARRGIPTAGNLPFGRTFDKTTGKWGIIEEDRQLVAEVAKRYLSGSSMKDLAEEYGVAKTSLWRYLYDSGPEWKIKFNAENFDIHEEVAMQVPELLPAETRKAIRQRAEARKTYQHGHGKNRYLLSRMVFCDLCGSALSGAPSEGQLYYRHLSKPNKTPCSFRGLVRAEELEESVVEQLFEMLGNPLAVKRANEAAMPNLEKLKKYQKDIEKIDKDLEKIKVSIDRIVRLTMDGTFSDDDAKTGMDRQKERRQVLEDKRDLLTALVHTAPSSEEIDEAYRQLDRAIRLANFDDSDLSWEEKRQLLESAFGGKMPDGRRMGVYISRDSDIVDRWNFRLDGHLPTGDVGRGSFVTKSHGTPPTGSHSTVVGPRVAAAR